MNAILVILLTAAGFFAVALHLALNKNSRTRVRAVCGSVALAVGIFSYGYAYTYHSRFTLAAVFKTLLTVCRMFAGVSDYAAVSVVPLFQSQWVLAVYWLSHFLAFYVMANAAIEVLGASFLERIRIRMLRRGELKLIYGATPESIHLAPQGNGKAIVMVSDPGSPTPPELAASVNGVLFQSGASQCADAAFLRRIGLPGAQRTLDVYCLGPDAAANQRYAEALLPALEARGVRAEATSLFLLGVPEDVAARFQARDGAYGFGSVFACDRYELIARLAMRRQPPWALLNYDRDGRAAGDFGVCIVGFGQMGRAMLKQLILNGQMEGSTFHASVFDRRMDDLRGCLDACYPELLKAYDITLNAADADSDLFFESLVEKRPRMIALCTSDGKQNAELARDIERLYAARRLEKPCVIQCTPDALIVGDEVYRLEGIDVRSMDRGAMILNHSYCHGPSPQADWRDCDPFSRASCRASFDFFPAFLHAAGVSREDVLAGHWPPRPEVLENLARTEHLRWCAFHLAMGYAPMSDEEFDRRAELYRRGELTRVAKDARRMTHACLTPWEALDELSGRENRVTGGDVDYKALDRNNVLAVPELLRQAE